MRVKQCDIFTLKKEFSYSNIFLETGDRMMCSYAHHDDRSMVSTNDIVPGTSRIETQFSMSRDRIRNGLTILYFWDYFETIKERRKRIIKELCK